MFKENVLCFQRAFSTVINSIKNVKVIRKVGEFRQKMKECKEGYEQSENIYFKDFEDRWTFVQSQLCWFLAPTQ